MHEARMQAAVKAQINAVDLCLVLDQQEGPRLQSM